MSETKGPKHQTAAELVFVVRGELPKTGGMVTIATLPSALTRAHLTRARQQLDEALETAIAFRLSRPRIHVRTGDGRILRETRLLEHPDRDRYLVDEVTPKADSGEVADWLVHVVADFGRKRIL